MIIHTYKGIPVVFLSDNPDFLRMHHTLVYGTCRISHKWLAQAKEQEVDARVLEAMEIAYQQLQHFDAPRTPEDKVMTAVKFDPHENPVGTQKVPVEAVIMAVYTQIFDMVYDITAVICRATELDKIAYGMRETNHE